jgi:hypothetical protein
LTTQEELGRVLDKVVMSFEVKIVENSTLKRQFSQVNTLTGLQATISKLLGQGIGAPLVTKDHWYKEPDNGPKTVTSITLSRLTIRRGIATLVCDLQKDFLISIYF